MHRFGVIVLGGHCFSFLFDLNVVLISMGATPPNPDKMDVSGLPATLLA